MIYSLFPLHLSFPSTFKHTLAQFFPPNVDVMRIYGITFALLFLPYLADLP